MLDSSLWGKTDWNIWDEPTLTLNSLKDC